MRIAPSIPAFLLHALSWDLLLTGAVLVVLAVASALELGPMPGTAIVDLIGAAVCFVLALVVRSVARQFEQVT
jgi:hypothetical protein